MNVECNSSDRPTTPVELMKVECSPSRFSPRGSCGGGYCAPLLTSACTSSNTPADSIDINYTRSAQSELWADILHQLDVEAENGNLVAGTF